MTERDEMLALAKRADNCLNSRSSEYPSDVLRDCVALLNRLADAPAPVSLKMSKLADKLEKVRRLDNRGPFNRLFWTADADELKNVLSEMRCTAAAPAPGVREALEKRAIAAVGKVVTERDDLGRVHFVAIADAIRAALASGEGK